MESTRGYERNIPNLSPGYGYINQTVVLEQPTTGTDEAIALEPLDRNQQSVYKYEIPRTFFYNTCLIYTL